MISTFRQDIVTAELVTSITGRIEFRAPHGRPNNRIFGEMAKRKNRRKPRAAPVKPRLPPGPLRSGYPNRQVLALFLIAKVVVVATIILVFQAFDELHGANLWNRWHSGTDALDALHLPFANWDGQHYALLADLGYQGHPNSHAFFPLFPLSIRAAQWIVGDVYVSAFLLNLLLSYLFCYVFHLYAGHFLPERATFGALVLLLCWPTAFYLTVLYSEALFLLLLFGFLYLYDVRKNYLSAVFAFLLPLSRAQAVFVLAALLITLAIRRFKGAPINWRYEVCNVAAFGVGGLFYFGFFQVAVGDAFSGFKAQDSFIFGNSLANIVNPGHFLAYLFSETQGVFSYTHSLTDKIFVIASLLGIGIVARTKNTLWLVSYVMLVYPVAAMGSGGSFSRFTLAAAPILVLSVWTRYARHERILYAVGAALLTAQLFFAGRFALNLWVA